MIDLCHTFCHTVAMRIRARLITKNFEIEERRLKLGYTQADLADIIGIQLTKFAQIEGLKVKPTEDEATSISLELNTPIDILFPQGYEKIIDIFKVSPQTIGNYTAPLLGEPFDESRMLETTDAKLTINKLIKCLPPRYKHLIEFRSGINNEPHTLEETGKELNVTKERVRQMEAKAHEIMRNEFDTKK